jgi:hypothetical protein
MSTPQPILARKPRQYSRYGAGIILVVILVGSGFYYYKYKNTHRATEAASIVEEIGKVMLLPEGEDPTLATVSDKEKLVSQSFFEKTENGDKLLIFSKSGKAILYRPSEQKIINVTDINIGQESEQVIPSEAPQSLEETTPSPDSAPLSADQQTTDTSE